MKNLHLNGLILTFLLASLALAGCASAPKYYVGESMALGHVKRIAVLKLENHTQTKFVEERLRDIISTEILSRGLFEVVEKGDLERFFREEVARKKHETLDIATAQRLARGLKVDAYLAGSVDDYSVNRSGPYAYPVIAATLRIVDAKTGKIIWQATGSESGYSSWGRIFGLASDDANQVSFRLVRNLLNTLHTE